MRLRREKKENGMEKPNRERERKEPEKGST